MHQARSVTLATPWPSTVPTRTSLGGRETNVKTDEAEGTMLEFTTKSLKQLLGNQHKICNTKQDACQEASCAASIRAVR